MGSTWGLSPQPLTPPPPPPPLALALQPLAGVGQRIGFFTCVRVNVCLSSHRCLHTEVNPLSFIHHLYIFFVCPGPSPWELKNTPLHLACTNHHEEIAAMLLMRGASASVRNQYGITPYGVATKQAVKDVVQSVEKGGELARGKLRAALAKKKSTEVRPS